MISAILLFGSGVSLLATLIGGLKHLFSYFASARMLRRILAILLFISGVSLSATLIGELKRLFSYFALGRDAQACFQPFCFFVLGVSF